MDFIERWLGVSPDGGSGALEALLFASVAVGVLGLAYCRRLLRFTRARLAPEGDPGSDT